MSFADTLAKADNQTITGKSSFAYVTSFILGLVNVHCEKCFLYTASGRIETDAPVYTTSCNVCLLPPGASICTLHGILSLAAVTSGTSTSLTSLAALHTLAYGAFPLHGTARYGTVRFTFGGFSTGYCTWYLILF